MYLEVNIFKGKFVRISLKIYSNKKSFACTKSLVGKIIIHEVLCSEKQSNTYTISIRDQNTNTI